MELLNASYLCNMNYTAHKKYERKNKKISRIHNELFKGNIVFTSTLIMTIGWLVN